MGAAKETDATLPADTNAGDLEDRRVSTRRLAWIGLVAWSLFVVTDFADAALSGHPQILAALLGLRATGIAIAVSLLVVLRRPLISSVVLTTCDVVFFLVGSVLVALEGALIGAFASQVVQGIMILCFMRASLLPSHWSRAFVVSGIAATAFPLTIAVVALFDDEVARGWLAPEPRAELAYAFVQILAGNAIGAAGSHMVWGARRQVREARRLGSYRLKARIGSGASGDVWLARQDPLGRDVALTVLKTRGLADEATRLRFAREARAASLLRHPNTIRVLDFGASDDGVFFFAMELLDGVDLEELVSKTGPLPAARALRLAHQACGSLAEAHAAGIVHRDVKPANLFITRVGTDEEFLKLLDFGVASMVDPDRAASMTQIGDILGTPAYMSPEACAGERADARSDVYSVGAVLYFMLTGSELFPGRTVAETLMAHLTQAPDDVAARLAQSGRTVAPDLGAVVMRCLHKEREKRFQDAKALDDALRACGDYVGERRSSTITAARPELTAS
jgi:serine/threonine-protein kinase